MPRIARSGSTWRTGVSLAAASRSRHAATAWATARARGAQRAGVLQLHPRRHRVGGAGRAGAQLLARLLGPPQAPERRQLGDEAVLQLEQRRRRRRRRTPAGPSVSGRRSQSVSRSPLAGVMPSSPCSSDDQRRRAVADEAGGDLGVEQARRDRADGVGEHVEVLLGGVGDGDGRALEQPGQRRRVDRQRVDQHEAAGPGDLHQREAREVGLLAVELGVDGVAGLGDQRRRRRRRARPGGRSSDPSRGLVPADRLPPGRDPRQRPARDVDHLEPSRP